MSAALSASAITAAVAYHPVPPSIAPNPSPSSLPLIAEPMSDARDVDLAIVQGEPVSVVSSVSGTLTSTACAPGSPLVSGTVTFAVDGERLLNLNTRSPLWRELALGDSGDDVSGLQEELQRLGHGPAATGRFTVDTQRALDRLFDSVGMTRQEPGIAPSTIAWLPTEQVMVGACSVPLGHPTVAGEPLVLSLPPVTAASVAEYPSDLTPGDRVVIIDGIELTVDMSGRVEDAGQLDALAKSSSYSALEPDDRKLSGVLSLANPLTVYPVTPNAIVTTSDSGGCVFSAGPSPRRYPVTIAGSRLGRTYVAFSDPPPARIAIRPTGATTCD